MQVKVIFHTTDEDGLEVKHEAQASSLSWIKDFLAQSAKRFKKAEAFFSLEFDRGQEIDFYLGHRQGFTKADIGISSNFERMSLPPRTLSAASFPEDVAIRNKWHGFLNGIESMVTSMVASIIDDQDDFNFETLHRVIQNTLHLTEYLE